MADKTLLGVVKASQLAVRLVTIVAEFAMSDMCNDRRIAQDTLGDAP